MTWLARFVRRLAAVGLIAGLTLGLPVALGTAVGWPLPAGWPAASDVWQQLGDAYISDSTIVKALAVVLWLTWAQLVICLAVEVAATLRGRSRVRIPLAGPSQSLAGWLVGSLLLASSLAGGRTSATVPLASAISRAAVSGVAGQPDSPAPPPPPAEAPADQYVVIPGDNLWDIAEACIATGNDAAVVRSQPDYNTRVARFVAELFELNQGRQQPDGRWLRKPSLIRPGWILELPDGSRAHVAPMGPAIEPAGHEAQRGLPGPTDPDRGVSTSAEESAAPTTAPDTIARVAGTGAAPAQAPLAEPEREGEGGSLAVGLGVAAAGLGVGLARVLRVRQRQVTSRSRRGTVPTPPDPEFEELRASIARNDDRDAMAGLSGAMRDLSAQLLGIKSLARPRLVQRSRRGIEVLLSASALPAPPGWRPQASGSVWACPHPPDAELLGCPTPVLVTLGRAESGTTLHLDLETEGCVSVVGDPEAVTSFGRSLMVELAHSPLAETLAVFVVGPLDEVATGLSRVTSARGWPDVIETASAWSRQSSEALAANRWANGMQARASGALHDALSPLVILATEPPDSDELAVLEGLPVLSTLIVVALGWELPVATRIEVDGRELRIPALGISCAAQGLTPETAAAVASVLEHASQPLTATPVELAPRAFDGIDLREAYEDPAYEVVARVLGDIEVVGGSRPLSPLQTAVVAYIALHTPVAASRVEDAVWTSPTANRHKRLANTVSEARAALGAHHFPVAADGRYRVGPAVTTDLQLFERRVAFAATQSGEDAIDTLQGALELVRGPLFSYRSAERASFVWVDLENWAVTAELMVVDAALTLGGLCLDVGDLAGAVAAATTGLSVSPAHTGLTELLMRAHAGSGDRHAAGVVFDNHVNALQALDLDAVEESTLSLHVALLGGSRPVSG